jgi:hypothetical protein
VELFPNGRPLKSERTAFSESVRFRCPSILPVAIEKGAAQNLMTSSEYVRRSIIDRLKADGIDPAQLAGAA